MKIKMEIRMKRREIDKPRFHFDLHLFFPFREMELNVI